MFWAKDINDAEAFLKPSEWWHHILQTDRRAAVIKKKRVRFFFPIYRISARNMPADPGVARKIRPWRMRECHNCVIVPVTAAAVRIINTCRYSREQAVILAGHKMEKTGKHIGRGEGWLLSISCLCRDLLYQNTATSCVFDIHRQTWRTQVEERVAIFFSFIFTALLLLKNLVCAQQAFKAAPLLVSPLSLF